MVGEDDVRRLVGRHALVEGLDDDECEQPPEQLGEMPAKLLENIRPTAMAGLAKLVELVKK